MPIYEYRCNACQAEFEVMQKMSDPELVKCESCGQDKLEKLISWTTFGYGDQMAALKSNDPKSNLRIDRTRSKNVLRETPAAPATTPDPDPDKT
jgi:putative FmdB family regulatory protein